MNTAKPVVLELSVNNHPGVMSHITGLFSRRGFNLEGILCTASITDPSRSTIFLLIAENSRLDQVVKQLGKLYDVLDIAIRDDGDGKFFKRLHELFLDPALSAGH